jgi:ankyrin repeat protein
MNLTDKYGRTPLYIAAHKGQAAVTKQLIEARCNIDLQTKGGETALQAAQRVGHPVIATLIRNAKRKGAVRVMKDTTLQASPDKRKKQQEDADRAMKELLEEEEKEKAAAAAAG